MNTELMFSGKTDEWSTPQDFFNKLDREFDFNLDPCADHTNAKVDVYYTKSDNGISKDWAGFTVFCNPPYGRAIGEWVKKAYEESRKPYTTVVMLIPARTDTRWFHDYIYGKAEIRFVKGRLKFGGSPHNAPFPNMVVIFDDRTHNRDKTDIVRCWECKYNKRKARCDRAETNAFQYEHDYCSLGERE
jgi:phage N-6-adenine-methyltransferase